MCFCRHVFPKHSPFSNLLQEFADAIKVIKAAPPCLYAERTPPQELQGLQGVTAGEGKSFLSFVFEKRHLQGDRRETALSLLTSFRNYIHYHLKCSKAYMHSRMRSKTEDLLKVLRRAQPEKVETRREGAKTSKA